MNLTEYGEIHKVGRAWSALFDIASLVLVFLIGRRLYGRRVGLLAALFLAGSVLPIQLAHFFTVDSITAFFTLLTIYWAVRAGAERRVGSLHPAGPQHRRGDGLPRDHGHAGVAGRACRGAADLGPRSRWRSAAPANQDARLRLHALLPAFAAHSGWLALAGVLAFLAFRVFQPDAFLGHRRARHRLLISRHPASTGCSKGAVLRPSARPALHREYRSISEQFSGEADLPPASSGPAARRSLFPLQNMMIWGMGLPLGWWPGLGWALAGWQMLRAAGARCCRCT